MGTTSKKAKKAAAAAAKANPVAETATPAVEAKAKTPKTTQGGLPALPKLPSSSRPKKAKALKPCTCGCGGQTTGNWVPGHDARARGWAIRIEREVMKLADVPANERAGAQFMLKERKEKGLTGKGITLAKGNKTEEKGAGLPEAEAVGE